MPETKPRRRSPMLRRPVGTLHQLAARPERPAPPDGDPDLVDRVADQGSGGCPRVRRDVVAYLCVDVYESTTNAAMARTLSINEGSCTVARRRGRAAVMAHRRGLARSLVARSRADRAELADRAA